MTSKYVRRMQNSIFYRLGSTSCTWHSWQERKSLFSIVYWHINRCSQYRKRIFFPHKHVRWFGCATIDAEWKCKWNATHLTYWTHIEEEKLHQQCGITTMMREVLREKNVYSASFKYVSWLWTYASDAELNSLSSGVCLIYRTYL